MWLALCFSWQLNQPLQLHIAGGRYNAKLPIVGIVRGPLDVNAAAITPQYAPPAMPMAAFLAQCR